MPQEPHDDEAWMQVAIDAAAGVRAIAHPNPWVGAVVVTAAGESFVGATQPPGQSHAEVMAFAAAGEAAKGATLYVTLEPCNHHGRTPPCVDAVLESGVGRVVVGVLDPDPRVAGTGVDRIRAAGVEVTVGVRADAVASQLAPYLHHRRTGRPYVVLKLATTVDGRIAAADGTSQWITGEAARIDAHRLRAESDAIVVGAGTVRADDPALTVRHGQGPDPARIVLGSAPAGAKVHPCTEHHGPLEDLLDRLGSEGAIQVLVEGGARVAADFHRAGLVDRYVVYLAPALAGGDDGLAALSGPGAPTVDALWRGRFDSVDRVGDDLRIELVPADAGEGGH